MTRNVLACLVVLLAATIAPAQLVGRFSLPKNSYQLGDRKDPILVDFSLRNVSRKPQQVVTDGKLPLGCTSYMVEIAPLSGQPPVAPRGYAGSCLGNPPSTVLQPGESITETVDASALDHDKVLSSPGRYRLRMIRNAFYTAPGETAPFPMASHPHQRFTRDFVITMVAAKP